MSGNTLYVGGIFATATNSGNATVTANCIAQWNGGNWMPLGSGINSTVNALAVSGGTLYAGGYFTTAGNTASYYLAKATIERPQFSPSRKAPM